MASESETTAGWGQGWRQYCPGRSPQPDAYREALGRPPPIFAPPPHPSETSKECGNKDTGDVGWCDKDGCAFNTYRLGHEKFWGAGDEYTVDTTRPMTIVTQFVTTDGTDDGDLKEIRRFYIQDCDSHRRPNSVQRSMSVCGAHAWRMSDGVRIRVRAHSMCGELGHRAIAHRLSRSTLCVAYSSQSVWRCLD